MPIDAVQALLELSHDLGGERLRMAILGEGNTSLRLDAETFAVKASGSNLATLRPTDLTTCRFDRLLPLLEARSATDGEIDQALFAARVSEADKKPSIEALFHAYLLTLPGVQCVGHVHAIAVNQILCSPRAREFAERRACPDEIVMCGVESVFVPYAEPGLGLAQSIRREVQAFVRRTGRAPKVILLQNHGIIAIGPSAKAVLGTLLMAEKAAEIFVGAAALGGPVFLTAAQCERIAGRPDEHYRQKMLGLDPLPFLHLMSNYLAIDLGAESGRVIFGSLKGGKLTMKEIHRFSNGAITANGTLRWDIVRIFREIRIGLAKGAKLGPVRSIACDSWGVDYVLLKGAGPMLSLPYTYRDERSFKAFDKAMKKFSQKQLFEGTGIASISINTLYQLLDDVENRPEILAFADKFLLIGDYITWLLTGQARAEETLISGSQLWDTRKRDWAWPVLKKLGIPKHIFPKPVAPGTKLGKLLPYLAKETGLKSAEIVTTCAHDTAAAVAAVPATKGHDWAYLSSGTWSLLGVELPKPLVNETVREAKYTNEVGFEGTTRFLKNLVGLWVLQECRREWMERGEVSDYGEIVKLALKAPALRSFIRPDDVRFAKRGDMVKKVQDFCRETKQPVPRTHGEIARCVLESLALLYRVELDGIEKLTGRKLNTLHIVGGGCRNELLNQATADATGRTVVAGPVEATAAGNILVQAVAMKELKNLDALRGVVRKSFEVLTYKPHPTLDWLDALVKFNGLKKS